MNNTNEKSHLMYSTLPNIIIGFHGCDQEVFNKILYEHKPFKPSTNEYDWLWNVLLGAKFGTCMGMGYLWND